MEQFLTLTHRHRLQVLQLLRVHKAMTVENVMAHMGLDEQAARRALGDLHEVGLITMAEIKGRYIYSYDESRIQRFFDELKSLI